ncbi:fluoride efflux transporter CrcB [Sphingorhabdus arenilitoris]|uniref:Fluoride-specific ion channel FluC n=1 Tax=Sphingorhabdus arenilitoris TaxID=1490041 RepID=A0ABV8RD84_9SPHN
MKSIFLVMAGGAIGAAMRHLLGSGLSRFSDQSGWPWGTFAANISGGLAMGLFTAWLVTTGRGLDHDIRLFIGVGLLGGFTTFSAFSLEMAMMIERGAAMTAFAYAAASVVLALLAVFAGLAAGRAVFA